MGRATAQNGACPDVIPQTLGELHASMHSETFARSKYMTNAHREWPSSDAERVRAAGEIASAEKGEDR